MQVVFTMKRTPFDDLRAVIEALPAADTSFEVSAKKSITNLDILGSGGVLADAYIWLAKWQAKENPSVKEAHICLFAASHEGGMAVSDLQTMLAATQQGKAPINRLCIDHGVGLRVLELALELPQEKLEETPMMTEKDTMAAIAFGMEAAASGGDVLVLGDLAYGGETRSLCVIKAVYPDMAQGWDGLRDGVADVTLITNILMKSSDLKQTTLDSLTKFGSREIAAMVGAIIAARSQRIPVLLDGWPALAAAMVLHKLAPQTIDHCMAANASDAYQTKCWQAIGLTPLLQLENNMGQGIGGANALRLLHAAVQLYGH